ncbi:MAG: oxygenase MpaB family protein [Chitinophagales bacterium]
MINLHYQQPSNTSLEAFRQQSDPMADQLIQDLYQKLPPKDIGRLFQNFLSDMKDIKYDELPQEMQTYFKQNQAYPDWVDWVKIEQAGKLFLQIGPEYAIALLFRSLPVGYVSANTVKVLTSTGYLAKDVKSGTAKRLLETTQFIIDVMGTDAIRPNQRGLKSILKVRFIHAMVRYHLLKHEWDSGRYGIPINQEDMAGTILTFGVGAIIGLERMNVKITADEKDALVHFWSVVGHFIGVEAKINPSTYKEGRQLYLQILERQAVQSEDGLVLTKALSNFAKGFLDFDQAPHIQEHLIRYLIGNKKYSDMLGLRRPDTLTEKITFNGFIGFLKTMNSIRGNELIDTLTKPLSRIFATKLLDYFYNEFELKINFPNEIREHWGIYEDRNRSFSNTFEQLIAQTASKLSLGAIKFR